MHSQVKEVILESGFDWYYQNGRILPGRSSAEDLEHLVQLVVRRCALIAGLMEIEGRKNIGANILDTFGVKDE
jgi:hypothetical protein